MDSIILKGVVDVTPVNLANPVRLRFKSRFDSRTVRIRTDGVNTSPINVCMCKAEMRLDWLNVAAGCCSKTLRCNWESSAATQPVPSASSCGTYGYTCASYWDKSSGTNAIKLIRNGTERCADCGDCFMVLLYCGIDLKTKCFIWSHTEVDWSVFYFYICFVFLLLFFLTFSELSPVT